MRGKVSTFGDPFALYTSQLKIMIFYTTKNMDYDNNKIIREKDSTMESCVIGLHGGHFLWNSTFEGENGAGPLEKLNFFL